MAPFKFYCPCPQSILLESDTSQVGQQCQCPTCGMLFLVPSPQPTQAEVQPGYGPGPVQPGYGGMPLQQPGYGQQPGFPNVAAGPTIPVGPIGPAGSRGPSGAIGPAGPVIGASLDVGSGPAPGGGFDLGAPQDDPNRIVTVICPSGCELETPMDMIGTDAMCPQCNAQFRLRYEDTLEYKQEREAEKERRAHQFSESALKWAIVMAVLIGIGIVGMFVMIALS